MNSGFIVLWRKFLDTSFARDPLAVALAIHLLIKANHENKAFTFNGNPMEILRGQLITGRKSLADTSGINESTVRLKLDLLQKVGFCTIKSTNKFSIITICKYSDYQNKKEKKYQQNYQQNDSQLPTNYQQNDSQLPQTTIQPLNNDNNVTTKTNKVFIAPTLEEVREYCKEIKSTVDPDYFYNTYGSQGWVKANGLPVLNWKLTIKTWERKQEGKNYGSQKRMLPRTNGQ